MNEQTEQPKPMLKKYYEPTPKKWRVLGDTILWGCTALQASLLTIEGVPKWAFVSITMASIIGKALTNFFTEDAQ